MRIVAGTLRGRPIEAPSGNDTRPTIDRVREALFSSLYSMRGGFEGAVVLDAFAGSGALGIEALSRGAQSAVFYESSKTAAAVLEKNIRACGINDVATIVRRDVLVQQPTNHQLAFDLVFLDPPYAYDAAEVLAMIRALADAGALAPDAIIAYEHDTKARDAVAAAAEACDFEVATQKKYGKTGVTIIRSKA